MPVGLVFVTVDLLITGQVSFVFSQLDLVGASVEVVFFGIFLVSSPTRASVSLLSWISPSFSSPSSFFVVAVVFPDLVVVVCVVAAAGAVCVAVGGLVQVSLR